MTLVNTRQTANYFYFLVQILSGISSQLMVAEKKGTIRFYDLLTQQAILSLDCGQSPLMSADWCLTNTIKVGAVAGNDWLIWDITRSRWAEGWLKSCWCSISHWMTLFCACVCSWQLPSGKKTSTHWQSQILQVRHFLGFDLNLTFSKLFWRLLTLLFSQVVPSKWKPLCHYRMSREDLQSAPHSPSWPPTGRQAYFSLPEHNLSEWAPQIFQSRISRWNTFTYNVFAASDNGIDHRWFRPQLASDTSSMRYWRWQKALFLDDWNVECVWLFNKMFFLTNLFCVFSEKCFSDRRKTWPEHTLALLLQLAKGRRCLEECNFFVCQSAMFFQFKSPHSACSISFSISFYL